MAIPRKVRCVVDSITNHGGGVYTLALSPEGAVPTFRPGQFLHLTVDDYDPAGFWPESRVFSIASSPSERKTLRICYSVKGRYTAKMEASLKPGGIVWAKLPYGDFFINPEAEAVLIAGGTGISAFTAFLDNLRPGASQPVTLLYGARDPSLFLFQEMILERLAAIPTFNAIFFFETPSAEFAARMAALPRSPALQPGKINLDGIAALCAKPGCHFYISGPPAMLKHFTADLTKRGAAPERIHSDAWE